MIISSARRGMTLAVCVLTSGIVIGGGSASALSSGGSSVRGAGPGHAAVSDQAKYKSGDPLTSEIADAATLASVPAAPPEAPTAVAARDGAERTSSAPVAGDTADAATLASVPAAPPEAPPAAVAGR